MSESALPSKADNDESLIECLETALIGNDGGSTAQQRVISFSVPPFCRQSTVSLGMAECAGGTADRYRVDLMSALGH
jgi:hypothetical protein